jgi:hypothetical protein
VFQIANAEYGIEKKRSYNGTIVELLIHQRDADGVMHFIGWYTRQAIINHINQGHTYMTIIINGNWSKGADVSVVRTIYGEYLRTDRNQTSADNLDNIPEG